MKSNHFNEIVEGFKKLKEKFPQSTPESYKLNKIGKDTAKRFRWDAFWSLKGIVSYEALYQKDLNDNHIDTALKSAVKIVWG